MWQFCYNLNLQLILNKNKCFESLNLFYRFCMKCAEENLKYFPTETQQELSNIIKLK